MRRRVLSLGVIVTLAAACSSDATALTSTTATTAGMATGSTTAAPTTMVATSTTTAAPTTTTEAGEWIAAGDGWERLVPESPIGGVVGPWVVSGRGGFVVFSQNGRAWSSDDGAVWEPLGTIVDRSAWQELFIGGFVTIGDRAVAVGGVVPRFVEGAVYHWISWVEDEFGAWQTVPIVENFASSGDSPAVAASAERIVIVGNMDGHFTTWSSTDGTSWNADFQGGEFSESWTSPAIATTGDGFLAWIVDLTNDRIPRLSLWRSTDGRFWLQETLESRIEGAYRLFGAGEAFFVAADRDALWRSTDGVSWEEAKLPVAADAPWITSPAEWCSPNCSYISGVFDAGDVFIASGRAMWVDDSGGEQWTALLWISPDGREWTASEFAGDAAITDVVTAGDLVLAVGETPVGDLAVWRRP